MTSHGVVDRLRRILKTRKIGHCGTLDPNATGVLSVAIGSATKFIQYLPSKRKTYIARFRFGLKTSTDDIWGQVLEGSENPVPWLRPEDVVSRLKTLTGDIKQIPPIYSAIKRGGEPLYKKARRGDENIAIESRKVRVRSFDMTAWYPGDYPEADFVVRCEGGTYIRSLARDLGDQIERHNDKGCAVGATMSMLERTRCGWFRLNESAYTIGDLEHACNKEHDRSSLLIPTDAPFRQEFPAITLDSEKTKAFLNGRTLEMNDGSKLRFLGPSTAPFVCVYGDSPAVHGESSLPTPSVFLGIAVVSEVPTHGGAAEDRQRVLVRPKKVYHEARKAQ